MTIDYPPGMLADAGALGSSTLHEAGGRIGALPARIRPLSLATKLVGSAYPVSLPPGDNLWLHEAIVRARPGAVLVAGIAGTSVEYGYFGEVMAVACQARGIAGLVIDGGVRDVNPILELGFPVFSAAVTIRGTGKDARLHGALGSSVRLGDVVVHPGDLVVGDADGVCVIPSARVSEVIGKGQERADEEARHFERLRAGETTFDVHPDFPRVG